MKKILFLRDCTYNFRRYKKDERPDQWFFDAQADQIVAEGDGEVVAEMLPPPNRAEEPPRVDEDESQRD